MTHRKQKLVFYSVLLFMVCNTPSVFGQNLKRSVAVFDMTAKTVNTSSEIYAGMELMMGNVAMGKVNMVARSSGEQLSVALVKTNKFTVIERERMEAILKEQKLGMSGIVDPKTAADAGKMLGVQWGILGTVTDASCAEQVTDSGKMMNVKYSLSVKFVNTTTGQIDMAEDTKQEFAAKAGEKNEDQLLSEAVSKGVEDIVQKIAKALEDQPFDASISSVDKNEVYIAAGKDAGVEKGQVFKCIKKGKELKDPSTGEILGYKMEEVGEIKVTQVEKKFSIAEVVSGCKGIKEGDLARAVVEEKSEK